MANVAPAASGIVAVATAVVWTMTISETEKVSKPATPAFCNTLKAPNPRIALCKLPMEIQPVCGAHLLCDADSYAPRKRTQRYELGTETVQRRAWSPKYMLLKHSKLPTTSPLQGQSTDAPQYVAGQSA